MAEKNAAPIVVAHRGRRLVLTASGVTTLPTRDGGLPSSLGRYTTRTPGGSVFVPAIRK